MSVKAGDCNRNAVDTSVRGKALYEVGRRWLLRASVTITCEILNSYHVVTATTIFYSKHTIISGGLRDRHEIYGVIKLLYRLVTGEDIRDTTSTS
jgi:hypothetical protein